MSAEAPQHPGRVTRRRFLRDAAVAGAAATAAAAATQSGLVEKAINAIVDWYEPPTTRQNPEVFDQTREFIEVSTKNSVPKISSEVKVEPSILNPEDLLVVSKESGKQKDPIYTSKKSILELPLLFEISDKSNVLIAKRSSDRRVDIKDTIAINGLPANTRIIAPLDGEFSLSQTSNTSGISSIGSLEFKDAEGNFRNLIFVFGVSQSLIDEKVSPKKKYGEFTWKQEPVPVKAGEPLFVLDDKSAPGNWLADQLKISISPTAWNEQHEPIPGLVFAPLDIKTQNGKAVYLQP